LYTPYKVLIGLLHKLIPSSEQILEKKIRYCVICNTPSSFLPGPNGRKNATCSNCGSLERHRALKIINEVIFDDLIRNQVPGKIIEVAPSGVSKSIFSRHGSNYESFDINPSADGRDCDFIADICEIPLNDNSVSQFVALHVLEHVLNDQIAMKEISRVLAPNAICILQVPLAQNGEMTQEEVIADDGIRSARYGQADHVRLYGEDILNRLKANGLLGSFISVEDVLPQLLVDFLGLEDGMKFIICITQSNFASVGNLEKVIRNLKGDYQKLEVFCKTLTVLDSLQPD
jgi:SAM-dependent methyltransferase